MNLEELRIVSDLTGKCARLEVQRDQLREALEDLVVCAEGYRDGSKTDFALDMASDDARAALKATED